MLVLAPTRELAVQIHTVARQMAQHAHIDICLAAGMFGAILRNNELPFQIICNMLEDAHYFKLLGSKIVKMC